MAEVLLTNVEKRYNEESYAVRGVSFHAADGEFVVLVGPSGCGKSTTLRMIAGLEELTGGTISIGGVVVNDLEPKDRDVAMVFQNYALYPHMSVYENMAFPLKMRKVEKSQVKAQVNEAAKLLNIEHLLSRKPKALSGGEKQRVAVGRAIVRKPKVFLFDEPLSNLDAALRTQMRAELKRLQRRLGATMLYVTHDQVEAMTMGDKIVVMNNGLVEQYGTPEEVYSMPASTFVARFLGSPPMNLITTDVKEDANGTYLRIGATRVPIEGHAAGTMISAGFRPESARICREAPTGKQNLFWGKLMLVEPIGSVTHYYIESHEAIGGSIVASEHQGEKNRVSFLSPKLGEELAVELPLTALHFFDGATGKRI
jgi:ABC-type sugar transport system ATPase subunit